MKMKRKYSLFKSLLSLFLCFAFSMTYVMAQQTVSGKVTDENGEGLPGVNIIIKGTSQGTTTDIDGKYSLKSPSAETILVFSYIGYTSIEETVGTRTVIDVQMALDDTALEELVVIGYGTAKKSEVTGSVAKLGEKDFNGGPVTNALQQINGRAAGVNINQVGSEPGQNPSIRIRGITSLIGGNDPLVVVDGIQGSMDLLRQIPPSEIESVEILKDASATAIYGSRGAAGVVLITTKKGVAGTAQIEYSGVASVETIAKEYEVLSASEWRAEAANRGITGGDFGGNTNWFDQVTQNGLTQTHNLAISGGSGAFNYRTSLTGIFQDGIIINSSSENYIARFQGTQTAFDDKLGMTFNLNAAVRNNEYNNAGRVGEAITRRPTDPIYDDNGDYFIDQNTFQYLNPFARAQEIIDEDRSNNIFGSMRVDYDILDGLNAAVFGSWRKSDRSYGQYQSPLTTIESARTQNGIATRQNDASDEKLFNFVLDFKRESGDHSIGVTAVYEWQQQVYDGFRAVGRGFLNDFTSFNALQSADATLFRDGDISSYKNDRTLASFLGRFNYSYKGKYILTASFRRDGSSVFGANNRWANFPSVSAAWSVSDEDFMNNVGVVSNLKLRAGYGETGNQQGLGPLGSIRLVSPAGTAFFGGELIPNFAIAQNANPDLRWEVRKMFNAGIDFGILDDKITGSIDVFSGTTDDLLFNYAVPTPPFPLGTIQANVGSVLNQGVELTLSYKMIDRDDFSVILAGNITSIKTEVQDLDGSLNGVSLTTDFVRWGNGGTTGVASTNDGISYLIQGQPLGSFYLFNHAGVDDSGEQIIDDLNGNGVVDDGDLSEDRYIAGQALPKASWAFTPSVTYKKFDLNLVFRGAFGHQIYNARKATLSAMGAFGQGNVLKSALETNINNITYASDLWLEDGDYARMENITLGYRFDTANLGVVKSLRLSFTANNLFVISDYSGLDPELSTNGSSGFGIDSGIYPRTRSFALGLNVMFQ